MSQESKVSRVEGMCRDVALRDSRQVTSDMTHMTDVTWLMTWGSPWVKPSSQARQSGRRTLRVQGAESRIQSPERSQVTDQIKPIQSSPVKSQEPCHVKPRIKSRQVQLSQVCKSQESNAESSHMLHVTCVLHHKSQVLSVDSLLLDSPSHHWLILMLGPGFQITN